MRLAFFALLPALGLTPSRIAAAPVTPPAPPVYAKERADAARELTAPFDWFSLVALQWLKPGVTTVGSAPGNTLVLPGAPAHLLTLDQANGVVTIRSADPSLHLNGRSLAPAAVLSDKEDLDDALASGTIRLWAINRNGQRYLRVKDANAPARLHFHGLRWFAPNSRYRVTARWIPFPTPHSLTTHNQIGQTYSTPVPGYAEFTINGVQQKLLPFSSSDKSLFFVFRDRTYLTDTYGGGRFLSTDPPSHGMNQPGTVILDFNEANNPPCAYTPFATCPLAAPDNRLTVAIPAGEKRYSDEPEEPHPATP